ncbi:diguanylate cyclase [Uliginosibacterium paludis]|uniref:diguanylate cyclase n=1 Tax=Uliginosibacterium paludis TaxID=1615952 RepID=A0ABV2CKL1_9RHOO
MSERDASRLDSHRASLALCLALPGLLAATAGVTLEWPPVLTLLAVFIASFLGNWRRLASAPDTVKSARLEDALARETALRRNTEDFVQRLIDVIPDPVYVKNQESRYLLVNRAFADYRQQDRHYLTGPHYPPEGPFSRVRQTSRDEDSQVLAGAEIVKEECVIRKATGEVVHRIVNKRRSLYFDGTPVVIGIDHDITRWRVAEHALQLLAQEDPLTGIANRRHFQVLAQSLLEHLSRYPDALSLVLIDLDHFKLVNDRYGHHAGDQVLVRTTERLRQTLRRPDIPGRWGGEEFIVLLPHTGAEDALQVAERLRLALAEAPLHCDAGVISVTLSAGVTLHRPGESLDSLIARADTALYAAKESGRNRVSLA